jgi:hypothetical protein
MYLEGGNAWWDDPRTGGYDFGSMFKIFKISGDHGVMNGVSGIDTVFTRTMNFYYTGENQSVDRINRTGSGRLIFKNRLNGYVCGVCADHRTIGSSIELAGLVDSLPPSTKLCLVDSIMHYFGISPSGVEEDNGLRIAYKGKSELEIFPNPSRGRITFMLMPCAQSRALYIYDISGRLVKSLSIPSSPSNDPLYLYWDGEDKAGRTVPAGIYFIRISRGETSAIQKIVFLK